ncbi:MAG: hypothetical protein ACHQUB_01820 [Candidatus Saccharimonadia bacterium]
MKRLTLFLLFLIVPIISVLNFDVPAASGSGGATFYASPSSGSYNVGDVIRVGIYINSASQAINAGEGTITWSSGLQYSFVSTSGSIFTTWTSGGGSGPVGSSSSVYFSGGLGNPGYNGTAGRVLTVIFNATTPGTFSVNVSGSQILANDGQGTNVLCCSTGATFTVAAAKPPVPLLTIVSKTHPNQNTWYSAHSVELNWYATTAVGNYSYSVDNNPNTIPTGPNNATITTNYTLADGIWYFHLKGSNSTGGSTVNFVIHIDSTPPNNFNVSIDNGGNPSNPTPTANFSATDATSGIDHYLASIDGGAQFGVNSGDALPKQHPGTHSIVVTAIDKAGNHTDSSKATFTINGITPPKILSFPTSLVILQPMDYIGQSESTDIITVYLNGQPIDSFTAKDKLAPKGKDKGSGGFANGVTWEYTYSPKLFPGIYKIYFSRINSVGAESSPSPTYPLNILATAPPQPKPWYIVDFPWFLIFIIVAQTILVLWLLLKLHLSQAVVRDGVLVAKPSKVRSKMRHLAGWKPFSWLIVGSQGAQRGFLWIGSFGKKRSSSSKKTHSTDNVALPIVSHENSDDPDKESPT